MRDLIPYPVVDISFQHEKTRDIQGMMSACNMKKRLSSALVPRTSASAGCPCAVFTIVHLARPQGDLGKAAASKEVRSQAYKKRKG